MSWIIGVLQWYWGLGRAKYVEKIRKGTPTCPFELNDVKAY
ncbi:hypothetical protein VDIAB_110719 [Vibrio diabolicus]|nr:hypothetical protein VDIAB_110719 [Vibrio diabolicus]